MTFRSRAVLALLAAAAPAAAAAQGLPAPDGRFLLDARLRFESFDPAGPDAEALTLRARLGYQTPTVADLTGLIEVEGVAALIGDYADDITPNPGKATIPDPEGVELNRAQVTWTGLAGTELTVGRQRIILGNARFVGNGGWRQNEQTFDAVKLAARPNDRLAVTYAYVARVNRTSGRDHPQGVWRGAAHLLQADLATGLGAASAYGYLLDLDNAPSQSSATYGARLSGARPLRPGLSATWEAEYARQSDWGNNPADFGLDYLLASAGLRNAKASGAIVYERLGGDGRRGFQTPLGTLHPFQGLSDVIGATPAGGLRDLYLRAGATLPAASVRLSGEAHEFRDEAGSHRLGKEFDLTLARPFGKHVTVEAGIARFETAGPSYPDATRGWLSLERKL